MPRFDELSVGDVIVAEVTRVVPFGALVSFGDDAHGLLTGGADLEVGAEVNVRIVEKDTTRRRASLVLA